MYEVFAGRGAAFPRGLNPGSARINACIFPQQWHFLAVTAMDQLWKVKKVKRKNKRPWQGEERESEVLLLV